MRRERREESTNEFYYEDDEETDEKKQQVVNTFSNTYAKTSITFDVSLNNFYLRDKINYNVLYDSPNDDIIMLGKQHYVSALAALCH